MGSITRGPHREKGGKKPRITNVLFLCKKEGQGVKTLHVLLSQAPQHEMFLSTHPNTSLLKLEVKQIVMLPAENKQGLVVSI